CDANRDSVHRVAAITLRIPVAGGMRLDDAARIGRPRPDLIVALARPLHRRGPPLPVIGIFWRGQLGTLPRRAEVDRNVDAPYREVAVPGGAAQFHLAHVLAEAGPVRRTGDDRTDRHGFEIPEVLLIRPLAGHHRIDGDPIRCPAHPGTVVHLVAQPDA